MRYNINSDIKGISQKLGLFIDNFISDSKTDNIIFKETCEKITFTRNMNKRHPVTFAESMMLKEIADGKRITEEVYEEKVKITLYK